MATSRNQLKQWFQRGKKPLAAQFAAWIDSFWHKEDTIGISDVSNLEAALDNKANAADLAPVASTGDYNDLRNKPYIPTTEVPENISAFNNDVGYLTAHQDISGKADTAALADVAFSGDYDDLDGKPTVPDTISLELNPNTYEITATIKKGNTTISVSQPIDLPLETMVVGGSYNDQTKKVTLTLKNGQTVEFSVADLVSGLVRIADLATVATTGSYNDLEDKPDLSGYASQADVDYVEAKVDDLEGRLPNNVSDLQDGSDYVKSEDLAAVATSGDYDDLDNKPSIPQNVSDLQDGWEYVKSEDLAAVATSGSYNDLDDTPDLASVATSGSYNDLSDTPDLSGYATQADIDYVEAKVDDLEGRLPNNVSDLQDGSDYVKNEDLAAVATSGDYDDLSNKPDLSGYATQADIDYVEAKIDSQAGKPNFYVEEITAGTTDNGVTTATISASTHQCGSHPIVQAMHNGRVVAVDIGINDGDITIGWSNLTVDAQNPLTISITGI